MSLSRRQRGGEGEAVKRRTTAFFLSVCLSFFFSFHISLLPALPRGHSGVGRINALSLKSKREGGEDGDAKSDFAFSRICLHHSNAHLVGLSFFSLCFLKKSPRSRESKLQKNFQTDGLIPF